MLPPSTHWKEHPAADEAVRFAQYAAKFTELQQQRSAQRGVGRVLHRKQHLGLKASVTIFPDVPDAARYGLFARPGDYDAEIRLSNGDSDRRPDRMPDVRGFAIRLLNVLGPGARGGETAEQNFALINFAAFGFPNVREFYEVVMSSSRGFPSLISNLVRRHGLVGGLKQLRRILTVFGQPFHGFALSPMYSAAAIACGPYAIKVRILPRDNGGPPAAGAPDYAVDMHDRLLVQDLTWDLQVQFFVDAAITPIEDASIQWPEDVTPFHTVGRLTVPKQDTDSAEGKARSARIETSFFDPWYALLDHRPLGEAMRARRVTYDASRKAREHA